MNKPKHKTSEWSPTLFLLFVIIFVIGSSSAQQREEEFEVDNKYLENLYNLSLVKDHSVRIDFRERVMDPEKIIISLEQLKYEIKKEDAINAKLIEIITYDDIFKHEPDATLVDLIFPSSVYSSETIKEKLSKKEIDPAKFNLEFILMTQNGLNEKFLLSENSKVDSALFQVISFEYFSRVKLLQLSYNFFEHLRPEHLDIFYNQNTNSSSLETLLLVSNWLKSVQHDTFHRFTNLRFIDLNYNKLKLIHPLTFHLSYFPHLYFVDLSSNQLLSVLDFTASQTSLNNSSSSSSLSLSNNSSGSGFNSLKHFALNFNYKLKCDCSFLWLSRLQKHVQLGTYVFCEDFDFHKEEGRTRYFDKIHAWELEQRCSAMPELVVDNRNFEKVSEIPALRRLSKAWFAHNVFKDNLPVTTPAPYLMSREIDSLAAANSSAETNCSTDNVIVEPLTEFYVWALEDAVFECSAKNSSTTAVLWKTQYGYFSNMDADMMRGMTDKVRSAELTHNPASFKIFLSMNRLTKVYKNLTVQVSHRFASGTKSVFYVNEKNHLVVTNMRHVVAGPFSCMAINERGMHVYQYEIKVRSGVGESFVLSLIVSLIAMVVPSIIGLIVCCYCEYEADKNYPMTPPCYPTPLAETPPNFDFNEWLANAGSYLPHLNIHDTLEQVSKKLRKGKRFFLFPS
jgi:hypothetical protein